MIKLNYLLWSEATEQEIKTAMAVFLSNQTSMYDYNMKSKLLTSKAVSLGVIDGAHIIL